LRGPLLQRGQGALAADLGVLLLLELEIEALHAGVDHVAENLILLVTLLEGGVGLDDALQDLSAELVVLAFAWEFRLGACGDFREGELLFVGFDGGGGAGIADEEFG
jgi:hypothetical protein